MVSRAWRSRVGVIALSLALLVGLEIPVLAFAALPPEVPVTVPFSRTGTLIAVPEYSDFEYWYVLPMVAGQTIEMTSTASAAAAHYSIILSADYNDPAFVFSDPIAPGVERIRYMAPHTGEYWAALNGSTASTFTVKAVRIPAVKFTLKPMVAPRTVARYTTLTASASLAPGYNSSTIPVRLYIQRLVSGHWKYYTSRATKTTAGSATYSKFSANMKFPRGTFRVRARFMDAAHKTPIYNAYKNIYVK